MAIIKCKMCGGDMELSADKTFGTCEYCGSTMTLPRLDDEQRAAAFNRGNHFRRQGEFDKALAVYERIVAEDDADAEAHWCCALCRFGIEYVEDPGTYEWLPTCHRASFDSFLEDVDYLAAVEHSDGLTRRQYQKDAVKIADVQKGILATSQNEAPFDVFLCYKESEEDGSRTRDSLLAQDIYYQLTEQGRRVFFARITLEDKGGAQYEPYIFAALHSARVMVVVTTSAAHVNAVWVKNEWSRFLSLMRKDKGKLLLPCYRDMDPYDLPEALSVLQSYDMAKIGFVQDLIRGVNKVLDAAKKPEPKRETVVIQSEGNANTAALLKRVDIFLEDGDWQSADAYCEKVLDADPECAEAYLGKLMAELHVRQAKGLRDCAEPFDDRSSCRKAMRYGDAELQAALADCNKTIRERNEAARRDGVYADAMRQAESARSIEAMEQATVLFASIPGWKDADEQRAICQGRAEELRTRQEMQRLAVEAAGSERARIEDEIKTQQSEIERLTAEEAKLGFFRREARTHVRAELSKAQGRLPGLKSEKIKIIYRGAAAFYAAGDYKTAYEAFKEAGDYEDAAVQAKKAAYLWAEECLMGGNVRLAGLAFGKAGDYGDAWSRSLALRDYARASIAAGCFHAAGLKPNGTVVTIGENKFDQCNTELWTDIIAISAGSANTAGLKADGTVVAVGINGDGQCSTENWTNIVAIASGAFHTIGLKADGTVVAVGGNNVGQCNTGGWTDIMAIAAGYLHTVGLKVDGTVVTTGDNEYGQCNTGKWTGIVAIAAGGRHTIGLKADGTVIAVGTNAAGECNTGNWTNIVAIATDLRHTVGLKADGTVVAVGNNEDGRCDTQGWTNVVAVAVSEDYSLGLKADGTVVAVGGNEFGQCNVGSLAGIRVPKR